MVVVVSQFALSGSPLRTSIGIWETDHPRTTVLTGSITMATTAKRIVSGLLEKSRGITEGRIGQSSSTVR
jgi:hypothetical protein